MKFQLLSNLWGRFPQYFQARAPTLILAGNIGHLYSPTIWNTVNALSHDFDNVYWIPYAAETFTEKGSYFSDQVIRAMIHSKTKNVKVLSNDVIDLSGQTIVATSGWSTEGENMANKRLIYHWYESDKEFVNENCNTDSVLISAGPLIHKKPKVHILGTPSLQGERRIIHNSAFSENFCANRVFTLE